MRKYILSLLALTLCCVSSNGQTKSAGIQPAATDNTLPVVEGEHNYVYTRTMLDKSGEQYVDDIRYYDGLGREYEHVDVTRQLVSLQEYDAMGRKSDTWQPASVNALASFVPADICKLSAASDYKDARAFAQTKYEASPLGRVTEQYGPGEAWQNRPVRTEYLTNGPEASLRCSLYGVNAQDGALVRQSDYLPGELKVTKVTDEDMNVTYTFTDKSENEILVRKQNGDEWLDTYFVYDNSKRLCYILPPMINDVISTDNLNLYAYQYRYDDCGRCIRMKRPGCEPTEYVYDSTDKLVYFQEGNQKASNQWNFQFSDKLGRPVMSGIGEAPAGKRPDVSNVQVYVERASDGGTMNTGYNICNGAAIDKYHLKSVNFYDDYLFRSLDTYPPFYLTYLFQDYPKHLMKVQRDFFVLSPYITGLLTGQRNYLADSDEYEVTVFYYDNKGRVVQKRAINMMGGYDVDFHAYTFTGLPGKHIHVQNLPEKGITLSEYYEYIYDREGKLSEVKHQLNEQPPVTLSLNEYDRLKRLAGIRLNDWKTYQRYNYNVRNQVTTISGPHFQQNLYYTDGNGLPCYNGNISSMTWQAGNGSATHGYKFTYDGVGRMLNATYGENASMDANINRFTEQITGYDKNGNLKGLKRYGRTNAGSYGLVDDLAFTFRGNQMQTMNGSSQYLYDGSGNQTRDLSKNVNNIQYNFLNLPHIVSFTDKSTITNTYDADGVKHRTVYTINGDSTVRNYCGNVIYEGDVPKLLLTETGYITLSDKVYHFYLKDHQGNVRMVVNQSDAVEEVNHYYPFGGLFASSGNVQPYKYNGKELETVKGLNRYDYGARHYDASKARFTTIDPLSENDCSVSPYAYCMNNPMRFIDPDGKGWKEALPHLRNSIAGNMLFGLNAGASFKVSGINFATQINAGSIQMGSDGFKATTGLSLGVGIVDFEKYDNVYELDSSHTIKEEGTKVRVPLWSEERKTTTVFDSNGKTYEEVIKKEAINTEVGNIDISAALGVGVEIKIDTKELWNFVIELFK